MISLRRKNFRLFFLMVLALILAVATYGFAAANTGISDHAFGEGSGTVSGHAVSAINWNIDDTDPSMLTNLTFTLTPALDPTDGAVWVQVDVNDSTGPLHACTFSGTTVTCTSANLDDPTIQEIDILRVVTKDGADITVTP